MGKYFSFKGSATRSEDWAVWIISMISSLVVAGISLAILSSIDPAVQLIGVILLIAGCIAGAWLAYATSARRCRDAGLNPWWTLATLVPYVGFVVWIVIGSLKSIEN